MTTIQESIFFLAESLTVYHMGRVSDLYGRKPILLIGPLGLSLAMLSFGLSQSFWGMVVTRAAMGVFNGNIGVLIFLAVRDLSHSTGFSSGVSKTIMAEVRSMFYDVPD